MDLILPAYGFITSIPDPIVTYEVCNKNRGPAGQ